MNNFKLDSRLDNDCITLGKLNNSLLLLMNNALLPWFILVPITSESEIIDLPLNEQHQLHDEINLLGSFVKNNFKISKLNIAAIGNVVKQLHIHIVGRDPSDYCWPNVVWGTTEREPYSELRINEIISSLTKQIGSAFNTKTIIKG
ncbi:hypothetical protein MNBD_GAMMA22-2664 [hydrothermal vent metagenome]|uniref:HIT domain-containing protein n=1 Tax=hydrothermal vent metagenome TaxID=652676 RepID=A0A3B0ZSX0_9ZZZZ